MKINNKHSLNQNANRKIGFKALKKVSYIGDFRPYTDMSDNTILKSFNESNAFKKFADRFDVCAVFAKIYDFKYSFGYLKLEYREIKPKEKNILKRFTSLYSERKNDT